MKNKTINPDFPLSRHSGAGRNPAVKNMPRSGQNCGVVPLTWGYVNQLDSGLRRNDAILANGKFRINAFVLGVALAWGQFAYADEAMPAMQGGAAPTDARDPHAYSGGYDFGAIAPPHMADVSYMGGLMVNRLEREKSHGSLSNVYDLQGWYGKDYERLVFKAEGEAVQGKLHEARTELLWSHALATYWNSQLGVRYDSGVAPDRQWLAFGVQGLAPYWFEVDATAYLGKQGRSALRLGAEYELLLTQKLILQPRVEANFYGWQDARLELGAGLSNLTTGLRLRYEIRREFAPYIGMEWSGKFGGTADYARAVGEPSSKTRAVAGLRFWF